MPDKRLSHARIVNAVTVALCVLWTSAGCSRSKTETPNEAANGRPASVTPAAATPTDKSKPGTETASKSKSVPTVPSGNQTEGKKAEAAGTKKDREDESKATLAKAIQNAEPLAAPALIPGKGTNINEFSPTIRKMVGDEFAFKDAQGKVYRASFSQRSIESSPLIKLTDARNAIVMPGTFEFDRKRATWTLHLWYIHWDKKTIGDSVYPETTDLCSLIASFDLDEKTARSWREAYDRGSLSLTVWFRPVKVVRASWNNHPRFKDGTQTHDIAVEVDVLQFEAKLDTPASKNTPGSAPPKKPTKPGDRDPFDRE